jgi:ABC-type multidrug transport system ATPase subunit
MNNSGLLLETIGLTKQFEEKVLSFKQDFKIYNNSTNFLIGPNGSGKSTLLKILANIEDKSTGTIINNASSLFYVGEFCGLYSKLSVIENIYFFLDNIDQNIVHQSLIDWELDSYTNKPIKVLSKGMQFRASLLISFLFKNSLILLDEPTAFLDTKGVEIFTEKLYKNINSNSYIVATHDLMRINPGNINLIELSL